MKIIINAVIENEGDEFIATHHNESGDLLTQIVLNANVSQTVIEINDRDTLIVQDVVEVTATDDLKLSEENALNEADNDPAHHVDSFAQEG